MTHTDNRLQQRTSSDSFGNTSFKSEHGSEAGTSRHDSPESQHSGATRNSGTGRVAAKVLCGLPLLILVIATAFTSIAFAQKSPMATVHASSDGIVASQLSAIRTEVTETPPTTVRSRGMEPHQTSSIQAPQPLLKSDFMEKRPLSELTDETLLDLLASVHAVQAGITTKGDSFSVVQTATGPINVVALQNAGTPDQTLLLYYLPGTKQHFFLQIAKNPNEGNRAEMRLWSADSPSELLFTEEGPTLLSGPSEQSFRFVGQPGQGRIKAQSLSPIDFMFCIGKTLGVDVTNANWAQLIASIGCSSTSLLATYETTLCCLSIAGIGPSIISATTGCISGVAALVTCGIVNCASHGTVQVNALLNGSNWNGAVNCAYSGAASGNVTQVPSSFAGQPIGTYTLQCGSAGPGSLSRITPSTSQVLSANGTIVFTLNFAQTVATPTFSLPSGTYTSPASVSISTSTPGATIRFTTNGSDPTAASTVYGGPLTLTSNVTLKAKAFKAGMVDSATTSGTYTIVPPLSVSCVAIPNPVRINQTITWQARTQGGSGSFAYNWLNGTTTSAYSKSYTATGTVTNWVIITDRQNGQSKTANCSLSVTR